MDPALQSALLVSGEIDAGTLFQCEKNPTQIVKIEVFRFIIFSTVGKRLFDIRMISDSLQLGRNLFWRHRRIHEPGRDSVERHRRKFRALLSLRESDSASCLDGAQTSGAVASSPGKHYAN